MFDCKLQVTPHGTRFLTGLLAGGLALGFGAQVAIADHDEIPFDEAEVFFELNDTDGDLGIHAKIDGDEWKKLEIEDTREREILDITVKGRLRRQGLTEIFFESAEPVFADLPPRRFFRRFPEGIYEVEGVRLDGVELESEAVVTHLMPAPPVIKVNDTLAAADCDVDPLPSFPADDDIVISWEPVKLSHPDLGRRSEPIEVVTYEVVVEIDDTPFKSSTILPPSATSFEIPEEIIALGDEIKFEVLVRELSFNQTGVESCFEIEEPSN